MTERDPAAEEAWEHRDDENEWSDDSFKVEVAKPTTHVVSFRLPISEIQQLTESSKRVGETLSEFVRKAIAIRMYGTPIGPSVEVTTGAQRLVVRSHVVSSGRTENPADQLVPDEPPQFVQIAGIQ